MRQRAFHALKDPDFFFDIGDLAFRLCSDVIAGRLWIHVQGQQFRDLFERESQRLGALDELEVGNILLRVFSVPGLAPGGLREESSPFIIPNGLNVHLRLLRQLAYGQMSHFSTSPGI